MSQTYFWPFCQVLLKSEQIFWKMVIFGVFDPPLWRHRPKFWKWWRHQKIFQMKLGGCAKFQENRWSRFDFTKKIVILILNLNMGPCREIYAYADEIARRNFFFISFHSIHKKFLIILGRRLKAKGWRRRWEISFDWMKWKEEDVFPNKFLFKF